MTWMTQNITESLIILGLLMLAVEILVLGFSTFVLFFIGLSAVISGLLMFFSVIPETQQSAVLATGLITAVSAVLLWKPMKKMQMKVDNTPAQSDLIGLEFVLEQDVSADTQSYYRYSGIQWHLKSSENLTKGTAVKVIKVEVGTFYIAAQ